MTTETKSQSELVSVLADINKKVSLESFYSIETGHGRIRLQGHYSKQVRKQCETAFDTSFYLTDELEIPQRWYEAIQFMLAHRMSLELPQVAMDRVGYLEKMADKYLFEAEQEERDKSPIYWAPNISVYTR